MHFNRASVNKKKFLAAFFMAACILGVLLLAASLPDLALQPGQPFPVLEGTSGGQIASQPTPPTPVSGEFFPLLLAIIALILIIFPVRLLLKSLMGLSRRQLARAMLYVIAGSGTLLLIVWFFYMLVLRLSTSPGLQTALPLPVLISTSPLGFPPGWILWLTVAAILLPVLLLVGGLWYRAVHSNPKQDPVFLILDNAARSIRLGQDIHEIILSCYVQMRQAVKEEQGIERDEAMTPAEFEQLLVDKGFPAQPVHELTRLFELVRYGQKITGTIEEQAALACFKEISEYSQKARQTA